MYVRELTASHSMSIAEAKEIVSQQDIMIDELATTISLLKGQIMNTETYVAELHICRQAIFEWLLPMADKKDTRKLEEAYRRFPAAFTAALREAELDDFGFMEVRHG